MNGPKPHLIPHPIANGNLSLATAFLTKDLTSIGHHYSTPGTLSFPLGILITGRCAIQAFWHGMFDRGIDSVERKTLEWHSTGTIANEIGTYLLWQRDGHIVDRGTYATLWQWRGSKWQIHYDVWHSTII